MPPMNISELAIDAGSNSSFNMASGFSVSLTDGVVSNPRAPRILLAYIILVKKVPSIF